ELLSHSVSIDKNSSIHSGIAPCRYILCAPDTIQFLCSHFRQFPGLKLHFHDGERSYLLATGLRGGYLTEGQCCSGTHFPSTSTAPTNAPQTWQVWTDHCSRLLFRVRTACKSSVNRPSHGFTGIGIVLLFTYLDAASLGPNRNFGIGR